MRPLLILVLSTCHGVVAILISRIYYYLPSHTLVSSLCLVQLPIAFSCCTHCVQNDGRGEVDFTLMAQSHVAILVDRVCCLTRSQPKQPCRTDLLFLRHWLLELTNMTDRIRQVYNHLSGSNMVSAGKYY